MTFYNKLCKAIHLIASRGSCFYGQFIKPQKIYCKTIELSFFFFMLSEVNFMLHIPLSVHKSIDYFTNLIFLSFQVCQRTRFIKMEKLLLSELRCYLSFGFNHNDKELETFQMLESQFQRFEFLPC